MSGGSWDYAYQRVEDLAQRLDAQGCPYRRALGKQLDAVAKALHDIEWVDSCDYGTGDDIPAILEAVRPAMVLEKAREQLKTAIADGEAVLAKFGPEGS